MAQNIRLRERRFGLPIVAVDIDDVIFPYWPIFMLWHNQRYGTDWSLQVHGRKPYHQLRRLTEGNQLDRRFAEFVETGEWGREMVPLIGAQTTLRELGHSCDLVVITSRSAAELTDLTLHYLDQHFPEVFAGVHFCSVTLTKPNGVYPKLRLCKLLGAQYLIDDDLSNLQEVPGVENGVKRLLFGHYPWNQGDLPAGCQRVRNWFEAGWVIKRHLHSASPIHRLC